MKRKFETLCTSKTRKQELIKTSNLSLNLSCIVQNYNMKELKTVQLSTNGYRRESLPALDVAHNLWKCNDVKEWFKWEERYESTSSRILTGKLCYGPQKDKVKAKFGSDVHLKYNVIKEKLTGDLQNVSLSLEELKSLRDWKMVRNRCRPSWLQLNVNDDKLVRSATKLAYDTLLSSNGADWKEAFELLCNSKHTETNLFGVGPGK